MKIFYTIIYSPFTSISQERLNVGMMMLNDQGVVMYKYSQDKQDRGKKLFSEEGFKLIRSFLSSMD